MHLENIYQAKANLSKLIAEALKGEEVIICKAGKPLVRLVPYQKSRARERIPGLWKGKIETHEDF